jgi:type II secretion system protein N
MQKKLLYTGYIVIVTIFFLYYLFPKDAVTSFINHKINSISPDIGISIREMKPDFPPGVKLIAPDVTFRSQLIGGADRVEIRPSYGSLFSDNKTFYIHGDLYAGNLESVVSIAGFGANPVFDTETVFSGIRISDIPAIQQFESYRFSGSANGKVVFSNKEMKPGKGTAEIIVTESSVAFTPALFGLESMIFQTIKAEAEIAGQRIIVKNVNIDGRDIAATGTGSIVLRKPVTASTVNITGEIKPHPAFIKKLGNLFLAQMFSRNQTKTGGLPFRITGSLERPNFALR